MTLRPSSVTGEIPKIQLPKAETSSGGWKHIPHVNQLHPRGADAHYVNGPYNCAAASVAMLALGAGKKTNLTPAQLITELSKGIGTREGSTPQDVAQMLDRAGLSLGGDALAGDYSETALQDSLKQGNKIIAQVGVMDKDTKEMSAHYVVIRGIDAKGNYEISDPLRSHSTTVTPQQLREAVKHAPPDGGMLIPVAGPSLHMAKIPLKISQAVGRAIASAKLTTTQEMAMLSGATKPVPTKPAPGLHADGFAPVAAPLKPPAHAEPTPAPLPAQASAKNYSVTQLSSLVRSATLINALHAMVDEPDQAAFTSSDAELAGVDTSYHESAQGHQPMSASEERSRGQLGITYGGAPPKPKGLLGMLAAHIPGTPTGMTAEQFALDLRERMKNGDPKVNKLLQKLEHSKFPQDKEVLRLLNELEEKDPGIGKKINVDPA
jgi:hypothetical protein